MSKTYEDTRVFSPFDMDFKAEKSSKNMGITDNSLFFPIVNLVGVIGMLILNTLANILPLNGKNTGELSDLYPNLFVPPGWVFSIWGIIYILNILFVVWTFMNRETHKDLIAEIGYWYLAISIFNVSWLILWHYEQVWASTIPMILFLISLIIIHQKIYTQPLKLDSFSRTAIYGNFGVYLGWISLATIANITAGLVSSDFQGFGLSETVWTSMMLLVVLLLSVFMVISQNNTYFALVVIWAAMGIALSRGDYPLVSIMAGLAATASAIAIIFSFITNR